MNRFEHVRLLALTAAAAGLLAGCGADAVKSVEGSTGITASLVQDLSRITTPPTDGSVDPALVARLVVVTTQKQAAAVAGALGTMSDADLS